MPLFGQLAAALAAALHVLFFVLESFGLRKPAVQRRFGIAPDSADAVRPWAFNQGFYNLFLAVGSAVGLAALHLPLGLEPQAARTLVAFPCAAMAAAGLVLAASTPRLLRSALVQAVPPLVALASLAMGV